MPIEIRELHIKAIVGSRTQDSQSNLTPEQINKLKKEISKEVMEKVLRELRNKEER
jgi:hypothetical protein